MLHLFCDYVHAYMGVLEMKYETERGTRTLQLYFNYTGGLHWITITLQCKPECSK